MKQAHDAPPNEKCSNCNFGFCPEAIFCENIINTFIKQDAFQDRYSLLEGLQGQLQIYINGRKIYEGVSDQEAMHYFNRLMQLYTPNL